MTEKLITKAKQGDLASRRQVIAVLDVKVGNFLVDSIAPQLTERTSGYLRLEKTDARVGDNAPMAIVEFVDEINFDAEAEADKPAPVEAKKVEKTEVKEEA